MLRAGPVCTTSCGLCVWHFCKVLASFFKALVEEEEEEVNVVAMPGAPNSVLAPSSDALRSCTVLNIEW